MTQLALYGAYIIIRRTNEYVTWTYGVDVPLLFGLKTSQEEALQLAKQEAQAIMEKSACLQPSVPCRTGYCAVVVPVGQALKQIKWNDCVGYFDKRDLCSSQRICTGD